MDICRFSVLFSSFLSSGGANTLKSMENFALWGLELLEPKIIYYLVFLQDMKGLKML